MLANIIIMVLILGYCAFVIYKSVKNSKEGTVFLQGEASEIGGNNMGNSTGSTMYMFGAVIIIYIVGMLIYQGFQWIRKKREQKRDEEFRRGNE